MHSEPFAVEQPAGHETIWRYMSLSKFIALLKTQSLYMCPLTDLDDAFEGSSPNTFSFQAIVKETIVEGQLDQSAVADMLRLGNLSIHRVRGRTFVNCWHMSDFESEAMWRIYSSSNETVCIKTTCGKILRQLPAGFELGKVRYIDYDAIKRPIGPFKYDPTFLKRQSFEHEKEVRVVKRDLTSAEANAKVLDEIITPNKNGFLLPVALPDLIDGVYINPLSADWFAELVEDVTRKYGYTLPVSKSELAQKPVF